MINLKPLLAASGLLQPLAMFLKLLNRSRIDAGEEVQNHSTGTALQLILSGKEACCQVIDEAIDTLQNLKEEVLNLEDDDTEEGSDDDPDGPESADAGAEGDQDPSKASGTGDQRKTPSGGPKPGSGSGGGDPNNSPETEKKEAATPGAPTAKAGS